MYFSLFISFLKFTFTIFFSFSYILKIALSWNVTFTLISFSTMNFINNFYFLKTYFQVYNRSTAGIWSTLYNLVFFLFLFTIYNHTLLNHLAGCSWKQSHFYIGQQKVKCNQSNVKWEMFNTDALLNKFYKTKLFNLHVGKPIFVNKIWLFSESCHYRSKIKRLLC